jgi:cobalt/nickel transport system permease protein
MHLGNEALTPECAVITGCLAAAGLAAAGVHLRHEPRSRPQAALAAGLGALVFAAQAINVPVLAGTSAHLVGGVLLAYALGPALGSLTMAIVLVLQALVLGDGGLAALGANILNMALLPAGLVAGVQRLVAGGSRWSPLAGAAVAALSVPLAAALIVGETALFRSADELAGWQDFAARMIGTHLWVGIGEGALTLLTLAALAALAKPVGEAAYRPAIACGSIALALTVLVFPLGSALPDGYEAAAESSGLANLLASGSGALARLQESAVQVLQAVTFTEQLGVVTAMLLTALLAAALSSLIAPHKLHAT